MLYAYLYNLKITAFWDKVLCSLLETDRRFRGAHCLTIRELVLMMEAVLSLHQQDFMALYSRRLSSSYSQS
jgi:hypothetical protein